MTSASPFDTFNEQLDFDMEEVRLELFYHRRTEYMGRTLRSLQVLPLPPAVQAELKLISDVLGWVYRRQPLPINLYRSIAATLPYFSSYPDMADAIANQLEAKLNKIRDYVISNNKNGPILQ